MKNIAFTKLFLALTLFPLLSPAETIKIQDAQAFDLKVNKGIVIVENSDQGNSISFDDKFKDHVQVKHESEKVEIQVSDKLKKPVTFKVSLIESDLKNCNFLLNAGTLSTKVLCSLENKYLLHAGTMNIQAPESKLGSLFVTINAGSANVKGLSNKPKLIEIKTKAGSIDIKGQNCLLKNSDTFNSYGISNAYQCPGKEENPKLDVAIMSGTFDADFNSPQN